MKGRCTWNKFLNRTTQHWGRSNQFACDTFCSSCEKKTRHTGDFQRFHFETVHKLFSIRVIPLFYHRPLIVVNVMIPLKLNLSTYYVRQNPSHSAYLSSPPLPSWVVKEKVPVCRLISDCLVCSASSARRPNTNSDWGILKPETRPKMTKEKYPKVLTIEFWMTTMWTSAECVTFQNLILFCHWMQSVLGIWIVSLIHF